MDGTYAIGKFYVTEHNDVIIRRSNAITIWRTSAIEVIALLKAIRSKMKGVQEKKNLSRVLRVDRKIRLEDH